MYPQPYPVLFGAQIAPALPVEVSKSQTVRLFDVLLLGPMTLVAAAWTGPLPWWLRGALVIYGVATIWYNARNWLRNL